MTSPQGFGTHKIGLNFHILFDAATVHSLLTDQKYAVPLTLALCLFGAAIGAFMLPVCLDGWLVWRPLLASMLLGEESSVPVGE